MNKNLIADQVVSIYCKIFGSGPDILGPSNIVVGVGSEHESVLVVTFLMEISEAVELDDGFDLFKEVMLSDSEFVTLKDIILKIEGINNR